MSGTPITAVLIASLIVASVLIMGCSSTAPQSPENRSTGITVINSDDSTATVFDDAVSSLDGVDFGPVTGNSTDLTSHILIIQGSRLTSKGDAANWLFFVERANKTYVVNVNKNGNSVSPWGGKVPDKEILVDQIIHPLDLFRNNHDAIFTTSHPDTPETIDLTLSKGNYSLSITSSYGTRTMVFDAATGALISSNG